MINVYLSTEKLLFTRNVDVLDPDGIFNIPPPNYELSLSKSTNSEIGFLFKNRTLYARNLFSKLGTTYLVYSKSDLNTIDDQEDLKNAIKTAAIIGQIKNYQMNRAGYFFHDMSQRYRSYLQMEQLTVGFKLIFDALCKTLGVTISTASGNPGAISRTAIRVFAKEFVSELVKKGSVENIQEIVRNSFRLTILNSASLLDQCGDIINNSSFTQIINDTTAEIFYDNWKRGVIEGMSSMIGLQYFLEEDAELLNLLQDAAKNVLDGIGIPGFDGVNFILNFIGTLQKVKKVYDIIDERTQFLKDFFDGFEKTWTEHYYIFYSYYKNNPIDFQKRSQPILFATTLQKSLRKETQTEIVIRNIGPPTAIVNLILPNDIITEQEKIMIGKGQSVQVKLNTSNSAQLGCKDIAISVQGGNKINFPLYIEEASATSDLIFNIPQNVFPGEEFWVDVLVDAASIPVNNLKTISFDLFYSNKAIIDYLNYEPGDFLIGAQFNVVPDNQNGQVQISASRLTSSSNGNGEIIRLKFKLSTNAVSGQVLDFTLVNVRATNVSNLPILLSPKVGKLVIASPNLIVWPGDSDNNSTVNDFDINTISISMNNKGPKRPNASEKWMGQLCPTWDSPSTTFADCNGDGIVNVFDYNTVLVNYGASHSRESILEQSQYSSKKIVDNISSHSNKQNKTGYPPIMIKAPDQIGRDKEFLVEIHLGSSDEPVTNVKIISFELCYSNTAIVDYLSYEPGPFFPSARVSIFPDDANGKIGASVYQFGGGITGSGVVLRLRFKTLTNAPNGQTITFSFGVVLVNRTDGTVQPVTPIGKDLLTDIIKLNVSPASYS